MRVCSYVFISLLTTHLLYGRVPERWILVNNGQARAVIVRSEQDSIAAGRIAAELNKYALVTERETAIGDPRPIVILVGTLSSNPLLAEVAARIGIAGKIAELPSDGYLIRTVRAGGRRYLLCAGGGSTGAIYAASDIKNFYLEIEGRSVKLPPVDRVETPKLRYRWFWNWDVRTNWDLLNHDDVYHKMVIKSDSIRPNFKSPDSYLTNMKMVVDYMSEHKLNGLIVWGFLRDNHGGVTTAKELCRYARKRGVEIIPGVNIDRLYGGIYHEGDHPYNLETWLKKHPELRAIDRDGNEMPNALCAQKPANRVWIKQAIQWLYENFEIGGVNLEFSEHDVCYTRDCIRAREQMPGGDPPFYKDLARIMPFVIGEVQNAGPKSTITYATYGPFESTMDESSAVRLLPKYAIAQWTLTRMFYDLTAPLRNWKTGINWPEGLRPPTSRNIGYLQWGSTFTSQEKAFLNEPFRRAISKVARHEFEGIVTYGEESPTYPNVELNYLSFSEFAFNPEMSLEEFLDNRLAPLYGGPRAARIAWDLSIQIGDVRRGQKAANKAELMRMAYEGMRSADYQGHERWNKMISFIRDLI